MGASLVAEPSGIGVPAYPVDQPTRPSLPKEVVEYWDQRIRLDLQARVGTFDKKWEQNYALVRNSGSTGFRNGNLVAEFTRTLQIRLLSQDPLVTVKADDPDQTSRAEDAAVISQAVSRVAKLKSCLAEASLAATWASVGWIEVGHPLDSWSYDIMRSARAPALDRPGGQPVEDEFVEVSPQDLEAQGMDLSKAEPFDPFTELPPSPDAKPQPMPFFDGTFGYPWSSVVDPRLVVTNLNAGTREQMDYICRLRFLTRKELEKISGFRYPGQPSLRSETRVLFEQVEGMSAMLFPEMLCIAEVWIIRDRNNPEYNSWHLCYLFGEPEHIVSAEPNQAGGMVPLVPLKLSKLKKMYDTTLAEELSKYADLFDIGIKAMFRSLKRMLNRKWGAPKAAGLDAEDEKRLRNDDFSGVIKMNDPSAIKEMAEEKFDQHLFQTLSWVKSLAQSQTGASDIDQGKAIKDITARQTQALLEATGINVEGMKETMQEAAVEVVLKLMHLVGMYNHAGRARKYQYGNQMVSMDRGTHDFTSSYIYDVKVEDSKLVVSNEERMVWNQLLKTLFVDTGGVLLPYLDREYVARATVRKYGEGPEMLASRAALRPPEGTNPAQLQAALPENMQGAAGVPPGLRLLDAVQGQHPERELGAQSGGEQPLSLSNALSGLSRVGS